MSTNQAELSIKQAQPGNGYLLIEDTGTSLIFTRLVKRNPM
jgi:hypothetical protein